MNGEEFVTPKYYLLLPPLKNIAFLFIHETPKNLSLLTLPVRLSAEAWCKEQITKLTKSTLAK